MCATGYTHLGSLVWALLHPSAGHWAEVAPCSGRALGSHPAPPAHGAPQQCPGLGQWQQLLQGEWWALLEAKVLFQKGKWFRQRSSWFSWAEGDRQCPGCSWSSTVTHRWHPAQAAPTAPRVFPSNAGCYLNLSLMQNITRSKAPDCQRSHFQAETGKVELDSL